MAKRRTGSVSEQRPNQRARDEAGDEVAYAQDLSVPMWVWTLLGFVLVVAVIIVVIIWGGGQKQPANDGTGSTPETMSTTEPAEPETMPATTTSPSATRPG